MKRFLIFIFLMLAAGWLHAQDDFYALSVVTSSGELVTMSEYKGKKVLIVVASPEALQAKSAPRYLGRIQSEYPDIAILVLPSDIGGDSSSTEEIKPYPGLSNTRFSSLLTAGKKSPSEKDAFLQWLTRSKDNRHFEKNIVNDEQFFVISESGVLYAVLEKGVPDAFLKAVLTAPDVKPQQVITDHNRQGYTPSE